MVGRLLRQFGPRLHRAASAVAELDCLLTLATLAADGGYRGAPYCRPQLTTETVLKIVNGATKLFGCSVLNSVFLQHDAPTFPGQLPPEALV